MLDLTGANASPDNTARPAREQRQNARSLMRPVARILGIAAISYALIPVASGQSTASPGIMAADGVFKGSARLSPESDRSCASDQPVMAEVHDGHLRLTLRDKVSVSARLAQDGSFAGAADDGKAAQASKRMTAVPTLEGRVSGDSLVADYGTRLCRYRLEASRF